MRRIKKIWLSGFLGGVGVSVVLGVGIYTMQYKTLPFIGESIVTGESAQKAAIIENIVEENYLEDVDKKTLADGMYAGMVYALEDPYSGYYPEEYYQKLKEDMEGKYTGIGLSMAQDPKTKEVQVVDCFADSPAAEAGIKAGDIIVKINGESVKTLSVTEIADQIKAEGTKEIEITLLREGEEVTLTIVPATVEVPVVRSRMLKDGQGYIQIAEFTEGTSEQFSKAYQKLLKKNIKGLVVDLRNNPGGLLDAVCDTLEQILPEGMIVYIEDKEGNREEYTCDGKTPIEIPMVVLVNEESASAAEIFAGAVKDHQVGTLVGTTTFGKGIVQKTFVLDDGSAVKLTTSKYFTPNGENIHGTGIEPDIEAEWSNEEEIIDNVRAYNEMPLKKWIKEDPQIKKSISVLESLVAGKKK